MRNLIDLVFEHAPVPILVTDPQPVILRVNRAFTLVTGYGPDEVEGRNPNLLASGRHDPDFYRRMWEALAARGAWEGEIWNRRKSGETYPEVLAIQAIRDDAGRVTHYVAAFRDVTQRVQREARLQHLSQHDPLTDLPNRALLLDRLDQSIRRARRQGRQLGLLFLDLDGFKSVNDTSGHLAGDRALKEVAARLTHAVRDMDTVARVGGDEFAILLNDISGREHAAALSLRVLDEISRPVAWPAPGGALRCSIGIGLGPLPGDNPEALLGRADEAMYAAKRRGGCCYVLAD